MIRDSVGRALGGTAIGAPLEYLLDALYGVVHPALLRDGATGQERRMLLPGDKLVPHPMWEATRAETVSAASSDIWPWLVQMGYGRGGWYAWSPFAGPGSGRNAQSVDPRFQQLEPGDVLLDGPGCNERLGAWTVRQLDLERCLVLHSLRDPFTGWELDIDEPGRRFMDCSWAFVLVPGSTQTRLLVRTRLTCSPRVASAVLRLVFAPGDTVMQRTMLRAIRDRVERLSATVCGGSRPIVTS